MDVASLEQPAADGLARATFEQDVVGHDDGGPAVHRQDRVDVLHEVQLLVRGGRPEVVPHYGQVLPLLLAFRVDHTHTRLPAEWRIRQYQMKPVAARVAETVVRPDGRFDLAICRADAVQ